VLRQWPLNFMPLLLVVPGTSYCIRHRKFIILCQEPRRGGLGIGKLCCNILYRRRGIKPTPCFGGPSTTLAIKSLKGACAFASTTTPQFGCGIGTRSPVWCDIKYYVALDTASVSYCLV